MEDRNDKYERLLKLKKEQVKNNIVELMEAGSSQNYYFVLFLEIEGLKLTLRSLRKAILKQKPEQLSIAQKLSDLQNNLDNTQQFISNEALKEMNQDNK